jgi:ATP-dependent protease HslVU (ClpYQ) peptidase subunit
MTVIVFKKPYMGSDSRVSDEHDSSIFSNKIKKIHQLKNGGLLGIAGDADHRVVIELFNKMRTLKLPTSKQIIATGADFEALLYLPGGQLWYLNCGKKDKNDEWSAQALEVKDSFSAVGSGAKFALGALDRGASVEQAIKTAIKYDPSCGGVVQLYKIEDIE